MRSFADDQKPTMKEFIIFLTTFSPHWKEIGLQLGLKETLLDVINLDNPLVRDRFRVTLQRWLEQNPHADWKTLELAITNVLRASKGLESLTMEQS